MLHKVGFSFGFGLVFLNWSLAVFCWSITRFLVMFVLTEMELSHMST